MPLPVDAHGPDAILGEVSDRTLRLVRAAATLRDADVAAPSLLPGWTRGHVLAHVARQAEAAAGVLREAAQGRSGTMYPSVEARAQAIEDGAAAGPAAQVQGLLEGAVRFLDAWRDLPVERRDIEFTFPSGVSWAAGYVPWLRWREVVLHHVDLDLPAGDGLDLPGGDPLVGRLLDETVEGFARKPDVPRLVLLDPDGDRRWELGAGGTGSGPVTVEGSTADLVLWLAGRSPGSALRADAPLPALPSWP
jgi:maleylpyruvate isomerase